MRPADCELCETPKEDPRRKDIGFDQWMEFKGAAISICTPNSDVQIYYSEAYYSEAQMRQSWIEGFKSAEEQFAASNASQKGKA